MFFQFVCIVFLNGYKASRTLMLIKLFGPNYLLNGMVGVSFGLEGTMTFLPSGHACMGVMLSSCRNLVMLVFNI